MEWSLITAANNDAVLESCLRQSECVINGCDFNVMRGFSSAGRAYNAGMRQAVGDVFVFTHQDMYLPPGWDICVQATMARLSVVDPQWAVLGVYGITRDFSPHGFVYCNGLQKVLGKPFQEPEECHTLDEVVLILRRETGMVFDEQLPGFHLYGSDICLQARQRGLRSYIIPAFCVHNTEGLKFLPWSFWTGYFYMRRKWRERLPIKTTCTLITRWAWPVAASILGNVSAHYVRREPMGRRVSNPKELYLRLARINDGLAHPIQ